MLTFTVCTQINIHFIILACCIVQNNRDGYKLFIFDLNEIFCWIEKILDPNNNCIIYLWMMCDKCHALTVSLLFFRLWNIMFTYLKIIWQFSKSKPNDKNCNWTTALLLSAPLTSHIFSFTSCHISLTGL
jgi:hypothetical protein